MTTTNNFNDGGRQWESAASALSSLVLGSAPRARPPPQRPLGPVGGFTFELSTPPTLGAARDLGHLGLQRRGHLRVGDLAWLGLGLR